MDRNLVFFTIGLFTGGALLGGYFYVAERKRQKIRADNDHFHHLQKAHQVLDD